MKQARIIGLVAGEYTLFDPQTQQSLKAKARGKFRQADLYQSPKVGDIVTYDDTKGDTVTITEINPRTTDLIRPPISNIDQSFLVFSVKEPDFNDNLLDRFLAIIEFSGIRPILIFSKWDLLSPEEEARIIPIKNYYESMGYLIYKTSMDFIPLEMIQNHIRDHISVVTGQSGVGKSTLLNHLDGTLELKTDAISKALGRGKHTTRCVTLIPLEGGWIADTPGFGTLEFEGMTETDLSHSFIDFFNISSECKFKGCLHINEPGCAVKKAWSEKKVLNTRYENYLGFINEIKMNRKW